MLIKNIIYCGQPATVTCDENCRKAWGLHTRPTAQLSSDSADWSFLSDNELAEAPEDPGTYEGEDAKPVEPSERMNKWCVRECERSAMTGPGLSEQIPTTPDFSKRQPNVNVRREGGS